VVGDVNTEDTEASKYIYIGFHGNVTLMDVKLFKKEFERYADVKDIYCKQSLFQQTGLRSFLLVELASQDQVLF